MRTHIAFRVADLSASVRFYEALLGAEPARVLPGYAQFLVGEPALNLALTEGDAIGTGVYPSREQHFGIEVEHPEAVRAAKERVRSRGTEVEVEEGTVCCHSRQDKFWATDPDGRRWEVFAVAERYRSLEEEARARTANAAAGEAAAQAGPSCCAGAPTCG